MIAIIVPLLLCVVLIIMLCVICHTISKMPSEEKGSPRGRKIGIAGAFALLGTAVFFFQFVCAVTGKTFVELKRYSMPLWVLLLIGIGEIIVIAIITIKALKK